MDESTRQYHHNPVLCEEVFRWLSPALPQAGPLVDCTVGGGGHAERFLERIPDLMVIGIDQDQQALDATKKRLQVFGPRVLLIKANFSQLISVLKGARHERPGAIFYDLGVSSPQLDRAERGFRFRGDGPLDMRMDHESGQTAEHIVNNYSENELTGIIYKFGDERFARRVAKAVVERRKSRPFTEAGDLAEVIKMAIPAATRRAGGHPARRTFQALRIEVNGELEAVSASLPQAVQALAAGGRLGVISYHSLEDRIVKSTFRDFAQGCICPRDLPICRCGQKAQLRTLTKKPVRPSEAEVELNPRSDSARLRVATKLSTDPSGEDPEAA